MRKLASKVAVVTGASNCPGAGGRSDPDMMNAGAPCTVLRQAVPIHPTVSEIIPTIPIRRDQPKRSF